MVEEYKPLNDVEQAMADAKKALREIRVSESLGLSTYEALQDYYLAIRRWRAAQKIRPFPLAE